MSQSQQMDITVEKQPGVKQDMDRGDQERATKQKDEAVRRAEEEEEETGCPQLGEGRKRPLNAAEDGQPH